MVRHSPVFSGLRGGSPLARVLRVRMCCSIRASEFRRGRAVGCRRPRGRGDRFGRGGKPSRAVGLRRPTRARRRVPVRAHGGGRRARVPGGVTLRPGCPARAPRRACGRRVRAQGTSRVPGASGVGGCPAARVGLRAPGGRDVRSGRGGRSGAAVGHRCGNPVPRRGPARAPGVAAPAGGQVRWSRGRRRRARVPGFARMTVGSGWSPSGRGVRVRQGIHPARLSASGRLPILRCCSGQPGCASPPR